MSNSDTLRAPVAADIALLRDLFRDPQVGTGLGSDALLADVLRTRLAHPVPEATAGGAPATALGALDGDPDPDDGELDAGEVAALRRELVFWLTEEMRAEDDFADAQRLATRLSAIRPRVRFLALALAKIDSL